MHADLLIKFIQLMGIFFPIQRVLGKNWHQFKIVLRVQGRSN